MTLAAGSATLQLHGQPERKRLGKEPLVSLLPAVPWVGGLGAVPKQVGNRKEILVEGGPEDPGDSEGTHRLGWQGSLHTPFPQPAHPALFQAPPPRRIPEAGRGQG